MTAARARALRWLAFAVAATLAAAPAMVAPASASATGVQIGVWWEGQPDGGTVPYPPHVPAGGLWVSSTPAGPSAMSAVRFALDDGDQAPTLTLNVAQLTTTPDSPATSSAVPILACSTSAAWTPTDPAGPGQWSSRPAYDCAAGQVPGTVAPDGKTVTFDLTTMKRSGAAVSVAIVPAMVASAVPAPPTPLPAGPGSLPAPPDPVPAPPDPTAPTAWPSFDAAFAPVTASSITADPGPTSATGAAAPDPATATIIADGGVTAFAPATGGFTPPAADATTSAPTTPSTIRRLIPSALAHPAAALRPVSRWRQLALGLILTALCAWAWEAMQGSGGLLGGSRPVLSLYDTPVPDLATGTRQVLARLPRVGKPPSLR